MSVHTLRREQLVPRELPEVFDFFARASNLEQITPPWLRFEMLCPEPKAMGIGTELSYRLRLRGIPLRWVSRIDEWRREQLFVDVQLRGPYRLWRHRHEFISVSGGTRVRDSVDYALPMGVAGELAGLRLVRRDLERIFDYRREAVSQLLG